MIPFHATRIRVLSPDSTADSGDPYADEQPPREVWAEGIRAVIVDDIGTDEGAGDNEQIRMKLRCDPCKIDHRCVVKDLTTGVEYEVLTVHHYPTKPLDHVKARLQIFNLGRGVNQNG